MNKLKSFRILGLLGLIITAFSLSVFLAQPSDATMTKYQKLIELGIVDAVVTPQEIALDYLQQEPIELSANPELLNAIKQAEESVSVMPENIALEIDGGTNSPIGIGQIPDDTGTPSDARNVVFEGIVSQDGQPRNLTPGNISPMFNTERNNGGNLPRIASAEQILLADASGTFLQAKRIPVLDLIVRRNNRRYVVPNVNANAVCRDALNAVFNGKLRRASQVFRS
ncbi:hypothetical protein [Microcoleus sp. CAWBG640]|uniref:hypothetical protein n=1 Tax=Microcoleus sp. CAWBG640 TaxID=2841653 RepID=UPI00312B9F84